MSVSSRGEYRKSFDSNFSGVTARLARVPAQIASLKEALDEHASQDAASVLGRYEVVDGQPTYTLNHPSTWQPQEAQVITGEIVHNLRSALENLVWLIAYRNSGQEVKQTQFPISESREDFDEQRQRRLRGLTSKQVAIIEQVQPYHGNPWLRWLAQLSNPDKHRHLILLEDMAPVDIYFTGKESSVTAPRRPSKWVLNKQFEPIGLLSYLHECTCIVARVLTPSDS